MTKSDFPGRRSVAFRVDASRRMGTGHLRRCLTLARAMADFGWRVTFVTRDLGSDSAALVRSAGLAVIDLPAAKGGFANTDDAPTAHAAWAEIDWPTDVEQTVAVLENDPPTLLVVDHYAFDARWHLAVQQRLDALLVAIDDLGDRTLAVGAIIDPTLGDHEVKHRISERWHPVLLGGPDYALLSPEYRDLPSPPSRDEVRSVGIFMGGTDIVNATEIAWLACRKALGSDVPLAIATTSLNPFLPRLQQLRDMDGAAALVLDLPNLADFFASHDLQIGAGGGASWERCRAGAPTILVAFAANQLPVAQPLHDLGVLIFCKSGATDPDALAGAVADLAADSLRRCQMSRAGQSLVDGRGVERILKVMNDLVERRDRLQRP